MQQQDLLEDEPGTTPNWRKRHLLPWWAKIFIWVFIVFGAFVPITLAFAIAGYKFDISLYGFETNDPLTLEGLLLITIFILKGMVAYGLWTEKKWAVWLGIADAILGLTICTFIMIYPLVASKATGVYSFRLEVIFLIPYLLLLIKIKDAWNLDRT